MKTQTLASLLITIIILLFSTRINSHGTETNHTMVARTTQAKASNETENNSDRTHQTTLIVTGTYHDVFSHDSDDDSHFLHFHFSRIRRNRRYYLARIITFKFLLLVVHLALLLLR